MSTTETRLRETEGQVTEERAALLARAGRADEAARLYRDVSRVHGTGIHAAMNRLYGGQAEALIAGARARRGVRS